MSHPYPRTIWSFSIGDSDQMVSIGLVNNLLRQSKVDQTIYAYKIFHEGELYSPPIMVKTFEATPKTVVTLKNNKIIIK